MVLHVIGIIRHEPNSTVLQLSQLFHYKQVHQDWEDSSTGFGVTFAVVVSRHWGMKQYTCVHINFGLFVL